MKRRLGKRKMVTVCVKADETLFTEIGKICSTPNTPTKAEFMRESLTSYLNYYQKVLLPTLQKHLTEIESLESVSEFYEKGGTEKYDARC